MNPYAIVEKTDSRLIILPIRYVEFAEEYSTYVAIVTETGRITIKGTLQELLSKYVSSSGTAVWGQGEDNA